MGKKVIVLLAEGFEEVEAVTPIDYLRRAGIEVTVAAITEAAAVRGSHDIALEPDTTLQSLSREGKLSAAEWDGVVCPGGLPGADNLAASKETGGFLKEMNRAGKWVCAICAAPARVLFPLGILEEKNAVCFPGEEAGAAGSGVSWKTDRVLVDGNVITARSAGTAGEFARAIIGKLVNEEEAKNIAAKVLLS